MRQVEIWQLRWHLGRVTADAAFLPSEVLLREGATTVTNYSICIVSCNYRLFSENPKDDLNIYSIEVCVRQQSQPWQITARGI